MTTGLSKHSEPPGAAGDRSDAELLARIVERDRRALDELYGRYYHPLLHFLRRLTGNLESAEEAVNDVMLVVWESARTFGGRSKVSTWIMGIAYRKAMRHRMHLARWASRFKAADWNDAIEPTASHEEPTEELERQDLVDRALRSLAPKQRAVVELTYYCGFSYEEIAEIVQCPENTVKTRMFHARARLRKLLPELGDGVR